MSERQKNTVELQVQIMGGAYVEDTNLSMVLAQALRCKPGVKKSEAGSVRKAARKLHYLL